MNLIYCNIEIITTCCHSKYSTFAIYAIWIHFSPTWLTKIIWCLTFQHVYYIIKKNINYIYHNLPQHRPTNLSWFQPSKNIPMPTYKMMIYIRYREFSRGKSLTFNVILLGCAFTWITNLIITFFKKKLFFLIILFKTHCLMFMLYKHKINKRSRSFNYFIFTK